MKLTWFGGTTMRLHIGGAILVVDAADAPEAIAPAELLSGADLVFNIADTTLKVVDPKTWKPRPISRAIDDDGAANPVNVWSVGARTVLIDAIGEPPLLLVAGEPGPIGRWLGNSVVVLFGDAAEIIAWGRALLDATPPRLIALAGPETAIDKAIHGLRDHLDGSALVSLEAGLALEA